MKQNNNPSLSVIVPVYNAISTIHRCLDSIVHQSMCDFELILINDGSTDGSGSICDEYAQKDYRIKVFHKKNEGVSAARNIGIDFATGNWITFIDSDDYISNQFFEVNFQTTADLILQYKQTFGDSEEVEVYPKGVYEKIEYKKFLNKNVQQELFRAPWGKFFRANIIKDNHIRFDINYRLGEDALFMLDYFYHIQSILSEATSPYKYYLKGDFIMRYPMKLNECLAYIHIVNKKFQRVGLENKLYLSQIYTFNTGMILTLKDKKATKEWFNDSVVKEISKKVTSILPYKTRLKYFIKKLVTYF